jgi:hypothetical protein
LFKPDPQKKQDKEQNLKVGLLTVVMLTCTNVSWVQAIRKRLDNAGFSGIEDEQINYALSSKYAAGDVDKAINLAILFQESVEGLIKPYNPSVYMKGAENRDFVTCWLDSVLFAMFAKLTSFEPILYTEFEDEPRRRLATLIRLWVNMMRTGMLVQTDIVCALVS